MYNINTTKFLKPESQDFLDPGLVLVKSRV